MSNLVRAAMMAVPAFFILVLPANAGVATSPTLAVACRGDWAAAVTPLVNTITGNAFGLFLLIAIPAGILAIIGVVFFHWSRHRGALLGFLGIVVFAMIAVQVWPGIANTLLPNGC